MGVNPGDVGRADHIITSGFMYAADAGANDTYAVALPTSPVAYVDGLTVRFKANTLNTGAASLNVNTLGAIPILRADGTALVTGDIVAGQMVEVVYRGGNFYMTSPRSGGWALIVKPSDETVSSDNTLSDDTDLKFAMAANTTYQIRLFVLYNVANASGDFKSQLNGPAAATAVIGSSLGAPQNADGAPGTGGITEDVFRTYASSIFVAVSNDTGYGFVKYELVVKNGANAGTFALQWAQDTSHASNCTVNKGSYLEYLTI